MKLISSIVMLCFSTACQASCWEQAGLAHDIDPILLRAIAWKESHGRADAVGPPLPNGHRALGLMQINSVHLAQLAPFGIRRADLFDACISQHVGAWVLADCVDRFGSTWRAVGCYYTGPASTNIPAQVAYVLDVRRYYEGYRRQGLAASATSPGLMP